MWIYGDRDRTADPDETLRRCIAAWNRACRAASGIERHGDLVSAHADLAGLLQGVADAAFEKTGRDDETPATGAIGALLLSTARMIDASRRGLPAVPIGREAERTIASLLPTGPVRIRDAEGFAHYAFYPEAWTDAARGLPSGRAHVIGLRSIGAALAPMAAVPLTVASLATLRPVGPHFSREVWPSERLRDIWRNDPGAFFVIVDEGPGLSGSSFCAVISHLLELGIGLDRIHALPSHEQALGRAASERHHALWNAIRRIPADPHGGLIRGPTPLPAWFEDVTGPDPVLVDLSGGKWRAGVSGHHPLPASNVGQERLKFRLDGPKGSKIAKFAGIGRVGRTKLARARAMAAAGFIPEVHALRHGFLLEDHVAGRPLRASDLEDRPFRERFLATVAAYLGFRARSFPASEDDGASLALLFDSTLYNLELGLGASTAERVRRATALYVPERLRIRRIATDGRLDLHEWLLDAAGRIFKTDAVDHAMTHDLVGAQDVCWDIAGAATEFDLGPEETRFLARAVDYAARSPSDRRLLGLMLLLYPAFRYAAARLAVDGCPADETERLDASARRYAAMLLRRLEEIDRADARSAVGA